MKLFISLDGDTWIHNVEGRALTAKMSPKFVVLSALAVGAIYATGYSVSATGSTALAASGSTTSNVSGGNSGQASSGSAAAQANGSSQTGSQSGTQTTASHASGNNATNTSTNSKKKSGGSSKKSGGSSSQSKTANTTQQYLDGTYSGSAANQIGAIAVNVTIQGGKIANVQITACYTHYPESYIDPVLPDYVVAHQTTQIPVVSGATLSTEDFYYAVVQALQSAQNPNYKG